MKKIFKIGLIPLAISSLLMGAEYMVPYEYDNTKVGTKSTVAVLIHNGLTTLSTGLIPLGGVNLRFKCAIVPKIRCLNVATGIPIEPRINAIISEVSLKEDVNHELLPAFQTEIVVQQHSDPQEWKVCAGAIGGVTWDESTITQTKDLNDVTYITHTYEANRYSLYFNFFTTDTVHGSGSTRSFLSVETKQTCPM